MPEVSLMFQLNRVNSELNIIETSAAYECELWGRVINMQQPDDVSSVGTMKVESSCRVHVETN